MFLEEKQHRKKCLSLIKFYLVFAGTLMHFVEALKMNVLASINQNQSLLKRLNYIFGFIINS